MKRFYFILTLSFFYSLLNSQTTTQISHYSVDNGLPENHVLCILQDHKGMMWFGTYDGLTKFDGYSFRNFKGRSNQKYKLANFRIDNIKEDKQGFLWAQSNDGGIYRFDSSTETFLPVPQCIPEYKDFKSPLTIINILPDGTIWLYNNSIGNENCFRVENTKTGQSIKLTQFSKRNGYLASDLIHKIYSDKNQNIWILTSKGITLIKKRESKIAQLLNGNQIGETFSIYENSTDFYIGGEHGKLGLYNRNKRSFGIIEVPVNANIIDIQQISNDELFLLTNNSNFFIYNIYSKSFKSFRLNNLISNKVIHSFKDKNNNIWIDADYQGIIRFDVRTHAISYLSVVPNKYLNFTANTFMVLEDKFNNVWIQAQMGGVYKYNKALDKLEPIPAATPNSESISDIVRVALSDNQGNLWASTYLQGVDKIVFTQSPFVFTKPVDCQPYTMSNEIRSIFQDSKNQIWAASKNGFVYVYNEKKELKGLLGFDGKINGRNPFKVPVYSMLEDHTGTIWLGTKSMGLFRLARKSDGTFKITNYQPDAKDFYSISSNSVYSIFEDHLHRIWLGTFGGGVNLLETVGNDVRFINYRNRLKNYPTKESLKVRYITEDKHNKLYFCTTQGLLITKSESLSPEQIRFFRYSYDPENPYSLSGIDLHYILPSSSGDVYLASIGGGVNVVRNGFVTGKQPRFEVLKSLDENVSSLVYTLKEDKKGYIWMSAQTQLVKYNPHNSKFSAYKPTASNNYFFDEAAVCQTRHNEIIYGTSEGFVSFDPLKIHKSTFAPRISLTQLHIFNKSVQVGDEDSPLQNVIDDTPELVLNHKQNIFSIEYAAQDYINPENIEYAYKLEGLETGWNYVGKQRIANFINLPKGKYVFRVKSTNSDGEWVNNEKTIAIIKLPSFWESAWGALLYFIFFVIFSIVVAYILFIIFKLRNEIDIEQRITNMKLRFFTDISHELRTPLTLIASPVDNLLKKEQLSARGREQLQMVQRNTDRMLRLINQILDFRKIQNKKMKLVIEVIRVADFLDEIRMSFLNVSDEKKIKLQITDNTNNVQLCVDKDKFEKIFFNLITNAFKFSPVENYIDIIINDDEERVTITIHDRGIGISKEKLKLLFNRFESFAISNNISFQASTGIGLSLTKELVELHKAKIEVESEVGKGSAFKVTFRKGVKHFDQNEEFLICDLDSPHSDLEKTTNFNVEDKGVGIETHSNIKSIGELPKVLIVEDNNELRAFLRLALISSYEVCEAENGFIALDMAQTHSPDIMISDIMMPDMDGLELTRKLKNDINTSHIPLILLTAKTDLESKLEALELGADDYITKPFNMSYLEARVENLLNKRQQLQNYFKSSMISGVIALSKPEVTNIDDLFIRKTMKFMEENYENPDMNVDDIALSISMSRSSFFKKIKSMTGLAPGDFIREFRIQKAIQLIEGGETNISQIAYSVGINDVRYFRKWFRQKCGINPSDFIAQRTNKN